MPDRPSAPPQNFFREGNLIALRELALRRTAERVDAQMRGYKAAHGIEESWHTGERVLVVRLSPSPSVGAPRPRGATHGDEPPRRAHGRATSRRRGPAHGGGGPRAAREHLRLAESLGGEAVTLRGESAAMRPCATRARATSRKIVVGKPTHARWRDVLAPSFLDEIVRQSREIDVYVISGRRRRRPPRRAASAPAGSSVRRGRGLRRAARRRRGVTTAVSWYVFGQRRFADVVMVYLLGIVARVACASGTGRRSRRGPQRPRAFDFFFVPPYFSFAVSDFSARRHVRRHVPRGGRHQPASPSASAIRRDAARRARAAHREPLRHDARARRHAREPASAPASPRATCTRSSTRRSPLLLAGAGGALEPARAPARARVRRPDGEGRAASSSGFGPPSKPAGLGTDTLPVAARPLPARSSGARGRVGVLGVSPRPIDDASSTPTSGSCSTSSRPQWARRSSARSLAEKAQQAQLHIETEHLRSSLLSSVSHDLRTPLAVITGAASALLERARARATPPRRDLQQTIARRGDAAQSPRPQPPRHDQDSQRARSRCTRSGSRSRRSWARRSAGIEDRLAQPRRSTTKLPPRSPARPDRRRAHRAGAHQPPRERDEVLSRKGSHIDALGAPGRGTGSSSRLGRPRAGHPAEYVERDLREVLPPAARGEGGGAGLGLAICRGIVAAHGGRIWVENRRAAARSFRFTLPDRGHARRRSPPRRRR